MPRGVNRALLVAASLLAIGTGVSLSLPVGRFVEPAAVAAARSLAELLAARSPGERVAGAVATKPPLVKAPRQRAKSVGAPPDEEDAGPVLALLTDAPPVLPGDSLGGIGGGEDLPMGAAGAPILFPGPGFFGGGGGGFIGGIGGGGGGGGGGGLLPPPGGTDLVPPPATGAIPEPSTWLTMLVGFGALGIGLRRNRKAARVPAAAPDPKRKVGEEAR